MIKNISGALLLLMLMVFSCSEPSSTDRADAFSEKPKTLEDSLLHDVLEGHDVAMAKMMKLSKYQARVKAQLDSFAKVPAASQNREYGAALEKMQDALEYAEMAMNTWMTEFKLDSLKNNTELRVQYLAAERIKVAKMRDAVLNSLAQADSFFLK